MLMDIAAQYQELGQKEKQLAILAEALDLIKTVNFSEDPYIKSLWITSIARQYIKNGQDEQALKLINSIENSEEREQSLYEIAIEYATNGQPNRASEIIKNLKNEELRTTGVSLVTTTYISSLVERGQYDKAIQEANKISKPDVKTNALNIIVYSYVEKEQYTQALKIINTIIFLYSNAEKYDKAIELANTITDQLGKISAIISIASTYTYNEKPNEAIKLLNTIDINNIKTNEPTQTISILTNIASGYSQANQKQKTAEILAQAIQISNKIPNSQEKGYALSRIAEQYIEISK
jgi:predicted Zn-dependent protease